MYIIITSEKGYWSAAEKKWVASTDFEHAENLHFNLTDDVEDIAKKVFAFVKPHLGEGLCLDLPIIAPDVPEDADDEAYDRTFTITADNIMKQALFVLTFDESSVTLAGKKKAKDTIVLKMIGLMRELKDIYLDYTMSELSAPRTKATEPTAKDGGEPVGTPEDTEESEDEDEEGISFSGDRAEMGPKKGFSKAAADEESILKEVMKMSQCEIVKPKETLADYVCNDVLKAELEEVKHFFENAAEYRDAGLRIPKGILFKGVPGTGKTYAARCIAGSTDAYFMTCTASSLQGQYIGSGAENIRKVFKGARILRDNLHKGVILFIDEIDSLGSRESHGGGAGGEEDRTLNQFLAEMSGFEDSDGVLILAATNYVERLDDALVRSGRFSRQITIDIPDIEERVSLAKYYLSKLKLPIEDGVDEDWVATITESLTPADISEILNEAGILALRGTKTINRDCVNEAVNKVITKNIRHPDKSTGFQKRVAVHEAGHCLADIIFLRRYPIKVTSYSYGDAGGFTQPAKSENPLYTKDEYLYEIYGLLGGRVAEKVLLGKVSSGASEDLDRAKKMLKHYYTTYFFDEYDPATLDKKIVDMLSESLKKVEDFYNEPTNKKMLTNIAGNLYKLRVLYKNDLIKICEKGEE